MDFNASPPGIATGLAAVAGVLAAVGWYFVAREIAKDLAIPGDLRLRAELLRDLAAAAYMTCATITLVVLAWLSQGL